MLVKRYGGVWLQIIIRPLMFVGRFLVRTLGIPLYRIIFFIRRSFAQIIKPTKHRLLRIVTNRYTVHFTMIVLVSGVVFVNVQTRDVRAETFGQKSILYALVAIDDSQSIEVVEAGKSIVNTGKRIAYLEDTILDSRAHIDLNYVGEAYVTPTTGGQTTPATSTPKREEIETYLVQEGDTLGQISERYGLNLSTILWSNNLTFQSTIKPGQSLVILPGDGVMYQVASGDTISRIASKYNVDAQEILTENKLASADKLQIGQRLLIPGGEPYQTAPRITAPVANLFTTTPPKTSKSVPSDGKWVWPTDWHVITQYYGWKHTGVDIDGDYTTDNYAARGGVVIYSGWKGGYGLTVEVDHGDGYVTRYGHHSKIYVSIGDFVTGGQALGRTGTTGRSTGTHLHFEVIKNGKFQNPLDYVR